VRPSSQELAEEEVRLAKPPRRLALVEQLAAEAIAEAAVRELAEQVAEQALAREEAETEARPSW